MTETIFKIWADSKRYRSDKGFLDKMSHIRVYGYSPDRVNVQVRSEKKATQKRLGYYTISNAHLSLFEAKGVVMALQAWIEEHEG